MARSDQMELIGPSSEVQFFDLSEERGITNIGSDLENDIVIDCPDMPPFYAILDHRQRPYRVTALSDEARASFNGGPIPANVPLAWSAWEEIHFGDYALVLLGGSGDGAGRVEAGASALATAGAPPPADALPPHRPETARRLRRLTTSTTWSWPAWRSANGPLT